MTMASYITFEEEINDLVVLETRETADPVAVQAIQILQRHDFVEKSLIERSELTDHVLSRTF